MSLLMNHNDQRFIEIAQMVFQEQFKRDPQLESEMSERRKRLMYDDVVYNINFLMTSVYFSDVKIFEGYAKWIYELLCNIMKDLDRDRIMVQMTDHYRILDEILNSKGPGFLTEDEIKKATDYLEAAIQVTQKAVTDITLSTTFSEGDYYNVRKAFLDALLTNQTRKAHDVVEEARQEGIPLTDIYEKVLAKSMHEVGELWHRNIITVDKEHYATSVTQSVMSSFYDEIFESPRKTKVLLSCAVGSELHEMGIRMLSDLFEYKGWDTYYLGAALPEPSVLKSIGENKPDLVALSVTMAPYLAVCENIVKAIQENYPAVKIAVGGQAFVNTTELWKQWGVDFYSSNAGELAQWAEENI